MKAILVYDHVLNIYQVYKYGFLFRVFGHNSVMFKGCGSTKEGAIENAERKVFGEIEIIEKFDLHSNNVNWKKGV